MKTANCSEFYIWVCFWSFAFWPFLPTSSSPAVLSSASAHPAGVCICVYETRPVSRANTDAPTSVRRGSHVRPVLSYLSTALWLAEWMERTIWNFCCITHPLGSGLINYKCAEMTLSFSFSFYLFLSFPILSVSYSLNTSRKLTVHSQKVTLKSYNLNKTTLLIKQLRCKLKTS